MIVVTKVVHRSNMVRFIDNEPIAYAVWLCSVMFCFVLVFSLWITMSGEVLFLFSTSGDTPDEIDRKPLTQFDQIVLGTRQIR